MSALGLGPHCPRRHTRLTREPQAFQTRASVISQECLSRTSIFAGRNPRRSVVKLCLIRYPPYGRAFRRQIVGFRS